MGVALFTSLALALTWTPNLSQYFIKGHSGGLEEKAAQKKSLCSNFLRRKTEAWGNTFRRIVEFHQHWLQRALANRGGWRG